MSIKSGFFLILAMIVSIFSVFGQEVIINYRSVNHETLSVTKEAEHTFYIQYENNRIGPFTRFFKLDNNNNMGEFTVKEIDDNLFFVVLATKPVSWGLEGYSGSFPIIGYNGNLYYPYYKPGDSDFCYNITPTSHELVYMMKTNEINYGFWRSLFRLYKGSDPISNEYEKIIPLKIETNDDIYYIGNPLYRGTHEPIEICKNGTVLFRTDTDLSAKDIQITPDNNFYYIGKDDHTLYKNDNQIVTLNSQDELSSFIVSNDGKNIVYTIFHRNNGSMSILKNGNLLYKTSKKNEMITNPVFSPDGTKLYYFNVYVINNRYSAFYINGPGIPTAISGPYLKPSWSSITFSNDSRYVAFILEGFEQGKDGICIVLNSQFLGPYRSTRNGHFTDDSTKYIFQYKDSNNNWIDKVITLK